MSRALRDFVLIHVSSLRVRVVSINVRRKRPLDLGVVRADDSKCEKLDLRSRYRDIRLYLSHRCVEPWTTSVKRVTTRTT